MLPRFGGSSMTSPTVRLSHGSHVCAERLGAASAHRELLGKIEG
jgi:hypothetical protein